jgi:cysteine rich repeat protein
MVDRSTIVFSIFCAVLFLAGLARAEEKGPVDTFKEGCKLELDTYCKGVTPGEGRVIACLYAYEDKLSARCEYALYDAVAQLQRVVAALAYVENECKDDLKAYCSSVKPGEGRLLQCIDKNKEKVSSRCTQAIKDVGLK